MVQHHHSWSNERSGPESAGERASTAVLMTARNKTLTRLSFTLTHRERERVYVCGESLWCHGQTLRRVRSHPCPRCETMLSEKKALLSDSRVFGLQASHTLENAKRQLPLEFLNNQHMGSFAAEHALDTIRTCLQKLQLQVCF